MVIETDIGNALENMFKLTPVEVNTDGRHRQYPDFELYIPSPIDSLFAFDLKLAASKPEKRGRIKSFSIGSTDKYFQNPTEKTTGILRPYNEYDKHLVLVMLHSKNSNYTLSSLSHRFVEHEETTIHEKWEIASKRTSDGNRNCILSSSKWKDIVNENGDFSSQEEFENWWRGEIGKQTEMSPNDQSGTTNHQQLLEQFTTGIED